MKHTIYFVAIIALFTACKQNVTTETTTVETTQSTVTSATTDSAVVVSNESTVTTTYNFEAHSDFQVFWSDFKKAVLANDREAVAKMTNFPFKDEFGDSYKQNTDIDGTLSEEAKKMQSFTCSNKTIFLNFIFLKKETG